MTLGTINISAPRAFGVTEGDFVHDESRTEQVVEKWLPKEIGSRMLESDAERYDGSSFDERRSLWDESEMQAWRTRRVGALVAKDANLVLTLLSFLAKGPPQPVEEVMAMGPKDRLFEALFNLYDLDLLVRDGASLSTSNYGRQVLRRLEIKP